jgi:hypothetical protein
MPSLLYVAYCNIHSKNSILDATFQAEIEQLTTLTEIQSYKR